ncbi:hypothetical protein G5I_03235 [Acromyrmex echinatior]|uniref:Uncharacterized protein n=1 Tax=Acromyrmex echinatior TaxID=103372 RepID=F4WCG0_ACREC|nr:hypothetical protein G5I_03235 [Acromyrmex echinatior]
MRSEKVRKGSVVLFGSCVAEAPTGRCYDGNVLFGPSRPTPRPTSKTPRGRSSRAARSSCFVTQDVPASRFQLLTVNGNKSDRGEQPPLTSHNLCAPYVSRTSMRLFVVSNRIAGRFGIECIVQLLRIGIRIFCIEIDIE